MCVRRDAVFGCICAKISACVDFLHHACLAKYTIYCICVPYAVICCVYLCLKIQRPQIFRRIFVIFDGSCDNRYIAPQWKVSMLLIFGGLLKRERDNGGQNLKFSVMKQKLLVFLCKLLTISDFGVIMWLNKERSWQK